MRECSQCSHRRASYATARVSCSSERARGARCSQPVGSSWRARGNHSTRSSPRRSLRALYIRERAARARAAGFHCPLFFLSFARLSRDAYSALSVGSLSLSPALSTSLCISLSLSASLGTSLRFPLRFSLGVQHLLHQLSAVSLLVVSRGQCCY